jgi:hypothetical protein
VGLADALGTAHLPAPPRRHTVDLDLQGEAEERADEHDQPQRRQLTQRGLHGNGAHQVRGDQQLQTQQQHAAEAPPERVVRRRAVVGASPHHRGQDERPHQSHDQLDRDDHLEDERDHVHDLGEGHHEPP